MTQETIYVHEHGVCDAKFRDGTSTCGFSWFSQFIAPVLGWEERERHRRQRSFLQGWQQVRWLKMSPHTHTTQLIRSVLTRLHPLSVLTRLHSLSLHHTVNTVSPHKAARPTQLGPRTATGHSAAQHAPSHPHCKRTPPLGLYI